MATYNDNHSASERVFVPMQVGKATVYIERQSGPVAVESDGSIRPVSPDPHEAFQMASEVVRECVRVLSDGLDTVVDSFPQKLEIEFSLDLEVKGKASIIPVFVTGETGAKTGLKVKAVWERK